MRKVLYLGSILLFCIILYGCGSKKAAESLSCEMISGNQTQTVVVYFDDENKGVTEVSMEVVRVYGDDINDDDINNDKVATEDSCDASDFSKCQVKLDGKKLTYYVETDDPSKLGVDKNKNKEDTKVIFETDGYICK